MAVIQDAVQSLTSLLHRLHPDEVERVVAILKNLEREETSPPENALVNVLASRSFTAAERLNLEIESLFRYFEWRRELLSGSLTAAEVASLLGTSRQTPHDRLKNQTLLGVLDRGVYRFPAWQFDPEGPDGVVNGLPAVSRALSVSALAKISWFTRPNPFLDGVTPLQALRSGQKERVLAEASAVGVR
jgi:hypothetical protein